MICSARTLRPAPQLALDHLPDALHGIKSLESLPPDDHGGNCSDAGPLVRRLEQLLDAVAVSSLFERSPKLPRFQADFLCNVSEHVDTTDLTALLEEGP